MSGKPVVLSGVQPTGFIHIGNYFGALRPWALNQYKYDNYFCIVDLHAITVPQPPDELHQQIRQLAAIYLSVGIDPEVSVIFVQSHVRAHVELCWLLTCITPMGWLNRMTQFKDKTEGQQAESIQAGLFEYPVLMAADILAYQADLVPTGEDQRQHLELTRDVAARFNRLYGDTFKIPNPMIGQTGAGARIMGLEDATKKMSKSNPNLDHAIQVLDPPEVIRRKLRRAQTDSARGVDVFNAQPGVANLVEIYRCSTGASLEAAAEQLDGISYRELKDTVAEKLIEVLEPVQRRYQHLTADPSYIEKLLAEGKEKASAVAEATAALARERMGVG